MSMRSGRAPPRRSTKNRQAPARKGVAFFPPKFTYGCLEKLERSGKGNWRRAAGAGREKAVQAVRMDGQGQREHAESDRECQYGADLSRLQHFQETDQNGQHFGAGVTSAPG